jgi:hypothetical protein
VGDVDRFRGFVEWKTIGWMILCFRVSSWCVQFLLDVVSTYIYKSNSRSYSCVFFNSSKNMWKNARGSLRRFSWRSVSFT